MHFSKKEVGPYNYLSHTIEIDAFIEYQYDMIKLSDQTTFIKGEYNEFSISYDVTSLVPIEIYFKNNCLSFESQKQIFKKLISCVWISEKYLLSTNKIVLDKEYVYVNPGDLEIKLIYLPSKDYENTMQKSFKELFLGLMFSVKLEFIENDSRLKRIILYLQSEVFDIMVFDSMLKTMKIAKGHKKHRWFKKNFVKPNATIKEISNPEEGTILMSKEKEYPILVFKEKAVIINKASFLIGRSKQMVDYAIPEALSMGRVHMELITESDGYYIIDINTKNGTYINGERIKSQKKYPIKKGDSIQLANEIATLK